jgi:hypothetical protein
MMGPLEVALIKSTMNNRTGEMAMMMNREKNISNILFPRGVLYWGK